MRVLLDTHVWLWFLLADARLSQAHRTLMEDEQTELLLSSISIWETHLLLERNVLSVSEASAVWIPRALRALPVREAGITFAIAARSRAVAMAHQDPADRFIAATAIELKVPLLTADERLRACPELRCL